MNQIDEAHSLLDQLQNTFGSLKQEIEEKQEQIRIRDQQIIQKRNELQATQTKLKLANQDLDKKKVENEQLEEVLGKAIAEKEQLAEVLDACGVKTCKYRTEFARIRKEHTNIGDHSGRKDFHFFLCYRRKYGSRGDGVISSHQRVIDDTGFVWWGKFFKKRLETGEYQALERFGESVEPQASPKVVPTITKTVRERIKKGDPVYLYLCDPNLPEIEVYVCNVIDLYYGREELPYGGRPDQGRPTCAYIPQYCFHKREGHCESCEAVNPTKCEPGFLCNWWFKVNRIKEIDDIEIEFKNLINCFSKDHIDFSIPILYPLLVYRKKGEPHFPELAALYPHRSGYRFKVSRKEGSHTEKDKIEILFDKLNEHCNGCLGPVASIDCQGRDPSTPELHKTDKDDEILLCLPASYREDSKQAIRFRISVDKRSKGRIETLIEGYFKK